MSFSLSLLYEQNFSVNVTDSSEVLPELSMRTLTPLFLEITWLAGLLL